MIKNINFTKNKDRLINLSSYGTFKDIVISIHGIIDDEDLRELHNTYYKHQDFIVPKHELYKVLFDLEVYDTIEELEEWYNETINQIEEHRQVFVGKKVLTFM